MAATTSYSSGSGARSYWEKKVEEERDIKSVRVKDNVRCSWEKKVEDVESEEIESDGRCAVTPVWSNIYSTIRERRRSRSQTSSTSVSPRSATPTSAGSATSTSPGGLSRSRSMLHDDAASPASPDRYPDTPDRHPDTPDVQRLINTPTREMKPNLLYTATTDKIKRTGFICQRFQTACYLEPKPVPVRFSSTVEMQLNSSRKKYVEEVKFQMRLVPLRFSEGMSSEKLEEMQMYITNMTIPCQPSPIHVISLQPQQISFTAKLTNGATLTKEEYL